MTISRAYDDVVYHCKATIPVYKGPPKIAGPAAIIIDMQVSLYHQYTFHILILHTQVNITAPRSLQVFFINESPLVEGNTVKADIMATVPGASFMCELLRKNSPRMMADCEW